MDLCLWFIWFMFARCMCLCLCKSCLSILVYMLSILTSQSCNHVDLLQAFLLNSTEDKDMTLSVRLPDEQGAPLVHNLAVKQHKTCTCHTSYCKSFREWKHKMQDLHDTAQIAEQLVIHSYTVFCHSSPLRWFLSGFWWHLQIDLLLLCQQVIHIHCTHIWAHVHTVQIHKKHHEHTKKTMVCVHIYTCADNCTLRAYSHTIVPRSPLPCWPAFTL